MNQNDKLILSIQKTLTINEGTKLGYRTIKSVFDLTEHIKNLSYDLSKVGCKNINVKGYGYYSAKLLINGSTIDILHSSMNDDKDIAYIDLFKNNVVPFINDSNYIVLEIEHELDVEVFFDIYEIDHVPISGYVIDYVWTQYTGVEPASHKGRNKIKLHCDYNVDNIYILSTKPLKEPILVLDGCNYYPNDSNELKHVFKFDKKINFTTDIHVAFLIFHNENDTEINTFVKTPNRLFIKPDGFGIPSRLIIDLSCPRCCVIKK